MTLHFRATAATDVGRVRDHNEDSYLIDESLGLVALADGMGGHNAGEVASAAALDALRIAFGAGSTIDDAVAAANDVVYEQSVADQSLRGMGTTLTAGALGIDGTLLLGHVGDSRAYMLRDGTFDRVTTDHSLVEELITAGELTQEEAAQDPRRSMITRAIGLEPAVAVDLETIDLRAGDRVLFCSDGLTDMLREPEIGDILRDERDPDAAAQQLVDAANAAGGSDNITVLVIDIEDDRSGDADAPEPPADADADAVDETPAPTSSEDVTEPVPVVVDDEPERARRGFFRRKKK
jgi:PPM family protein phosphatase